MKQGCSFVGPISVSRESTAKVSNIEQTMPGVLFYSGSHKTDFKPSVVHGFKLSRSLAACGQVGTDSEPQALAVIVAAQSAGAFEDTIWNGIPSPRSIG